MHHHKAIKISNLSYAYPDGSEALKEVNLEIANGQSVAIMGPNGAGKSTLLLHLNGILQGQGKIEIFGLPVASQNIKEIRRRVGIVFQDPDDQLFSPTVFDDVAFGPLNMGLPADEVKRRVSKALEAVEMRGYENKMAYHLSFGQKKRVATATALSMEPDILAVDEPSSNLDPRGRRKLFNIIRSLPVTKIIVTHDLPYTLELCERAIILDEGRVVADGPIETILSNEELLEKHGLELPSKYEHLKNDLSKKGKLCQIKNLK